MKKRRKVLKNHIKDYIMYGFTFVLCAFTVTVLLAGGGKNGSGATGGAASGLEAGQKSGHAGGENGQAQIPGDAVVPLQEGNRETFQDMATEPGVSDPGEQGNSAESGVGGTGAGTGAEADGTRTGTGTAAGGTGAGEAADITGPRASEAAPEISLVMVGDILLHTPVAESGKREDGSYDFSAVFAEMEEEISSADLALVNQEVILGGEELGISGYPAFNAPYELGDALADAGFDVVLHATNHTLDKGKRGVSNCLSYWKENHPDIAVLGIHESAEDQEEIYVYEQDGIRLAILNYTYGTNGIALPQDMPCAVDLLDRERVANDLQRAQELADFVVVCPHWGTEYVLEETAEQEKWAAFFAENGADLILGTHPHVIEPITWIGVPDGGMDNRTGSGADTGNDTITGNNAVTGNSADTGNSAITGDNAEAGKSSGTNAGADLETDGKGTLVYYSLGNFVNWTSGTGEGVANRMVGGMARVTIGLDDEGEAVITSYGVEPLVCHVEQGFGGVTVYPLDRYTEEMAQQNEIVAQDSSFSYAYCKKLVENVFGTLVDK